METIETTNSSLHYRNCYRYFIFTIDPSLSQHEHRDASIARENEVREHIPVPYDNLFQSILSFS